MTAFAACFKLNLISFSCSDIDVPGNLVAIDVTEDTVTLSWDRVRADVEGYMLSYTSAEGSSSDIPVGRYSTSYKLIGLKPGVLYNVYIWAFKEDKVSKKSSTEAETGIFERAIGTNRDGTWPFSLNQQANPQGKRR